MYRAYMQGDRKMRYFENDLKTERFVLGKEGQVVQIIPSREDSLDRLVDENARQFSDEQESVESVVLHKLEVDRLHTALSLLTPEERALIQALFFDERKESELAVELGISQPAVYKRKNKDTTPIAFGGRKMAAKRKRIPRYSKVQINGHEYYKTDIEDADGKRVILYGKTREEVYDKEMAALEQIDNATFRRKSPTVAEYCEKWLLMQSVHIRATTLIDYTSKVRRHIIKELGEKRMADVTLDDIQVALVPVSKKSASVYKSSYLHHKFDSCFGRPENSSILGWP